MNDMKSYWRNQIMLTQNIIIRSEKPKDYFRIAEVHALAFKSKAEPTLVAMLRYREMFDPELSLVAELNGQVIGHVLFSPYQLRITGKEMMAVVLAPIAVSPELQKQRVGKLLIDAGLKRAKNKNYAFSFLLGHPTYYPKFGYRTNMYGTSQIQLDRRHIDQASEKIVGSPLQVEEDKIQVEERHIQANDIPDLKAMWDFWFDDVDLAVVPGSSVMDWLSPNKMIKSSIILVDGCVSGYIRYEENAPEKIRYFLAKDAQATTAMINYVNDKIKDSQIKEINLPVHPNSKAVKQMIRFPYKEDLYTWEAAMIKILDSNNISVTSYCDEVTAGTRHCGMINWPVEFDVV